jgi:hypothetical protein
MEKGTEALQHTLSVRVAFLAALHAIYLSVAQPFATEVPH